MDEVYDTLVRLDELAPERPRPLRTPWGEFSLFRSAHAVWCVQSFCPHLGGPLFEGSVWGSCVTCPWHGWTFSLESGARVDHDGRPLGAGRGLATCAVEVSEQGTIRLRPPRPATSG